MGKTTFLIIFLIFGLNTKGYSHGENSGSDSLQILFIGSSYFKYNNLPLIFKTLCDSSGKAVIADHYVPVGRTLVDHADHEITEERINEKKWDYVIIQGSPAGTAYPNDFPGYQVYNSLSTLRDKILKNDSSTLIIHSMAWAFEDGMIWYMDWTDLFSDMQFKIYMNTLKYSNRLGMITAPVGWAWNRVLEKKDYPLHYLHMKDWVHPTLKGSYLTACVIYSCIFMEHTSGNPFDAGLERVEAELFQNDGSDVVFENPDLWSITGRDIEIYGQSPMEKLRLYPNYPNPFSSGTIINFETGKPGFVELSIYDRNGLKLSSLMKEYMNPGVHSLRFEQNCLPAGIYFYTLTGENERCTGKMVVIK